MLNPTRRKYEGNNLGTQLEVSERWREFAREKRWGKRAARKAARMKHKAARTRSRLDELMFGTFNVHTAAVNGLNGSGHIDTLLRPCAAKGCGVSRLQETKRDGIVAFGYRVYFSGDRSGIKDRKGQHGVGLAVKEDIVKKVDKDGIAIEYISATPQKARISIKSNFVTIVIADAPTEEAPDG